MMDIFGTKKLSRDLQQLRNQHDNLLHLMKVLAKEVGITVEIHQPSDGSAMIALVNQEQSSTVHFHHIRDAKKG